ncbi:hypothetical protein BpHYR1_011048 [Brachionus plicatilis]|uniref:Uncharacterized protein n=1 Tax=Brachionus plicatilis TaxID=10195 RepID=A0A3M7PMS5_BRAPC|nr:hypothetical protein BpHYR1_011048 [Brachionus plicatilis]
MLFTQNQIRFVYRVRTKIVKKEKELDICKFEQSHLLLSLIYFQLNEIDSKQFRQKITWQKIIKNLQNDYNSQHQV